MQEASPDGADHQGNQDEDGGPEEDVSRLLGEHQEG
jgi:hypothetical protein